MVINKLWTDQSAVPCTRCT